MTLTDSQAGMSVRLDMFVKLFCQTRRSSANPRAAGSGTAAAPSPNPLRRARLARRSHSARDWQNDVAEASFQQVVVQLPDHGLVAVGHHAAQRAIVVEMFVSFGHDGRQACPFPGDQGRRALVVQVRLGLMHPLLLELFQMRDLAAQVGGRLLAHAAFDFAQQHRHQFVIENDLVRAEPADSDTHATACGRPGGQRPSSDQVSP